MTPVQLLEEALRTSPVAIFWTMSPFLLSIGLGLVYVGFRRYRARALITNTPTEHVRGVAVGRTALQGRIEPAVESYRAPFTGEDCVYVSWELQERRPSDEEGDEWQTLDLGWEVTPFALADGTGEVLVDPSDTGVHYGFAAESSRKITVPAGEDPPQAVAEFLDAGRDIEVDAVENPGDAADVEPGYWDGYGKPVGPHAPSPDSTAGQLASQPNEVIRSATDDPIPLAGDRERRYVQEILPVGSEVYVFGAARPHEALSGADSEQLLVGGDPDTGMFVVSERTSDPLANVFEERIWSLIVVGLLMSAIGLGLALSALGV